MIIEINEKKIRIDGVDYPKGIFCVIPMHDCVRLDFVNTADKIDIFAPCTINGVTYENLTDIKEALSDEVFNLRWATSAEVVRMIAEAQLAGQEVDLSIYALKTDLDSKLNISDWTPYKNEVNSQLNQIADSILELDNEKVNRNELDNEYVDYDTFDNQNTLNNNNFALKTQLNNYATLDQLTELLSLRFWTTVVTSVDGVWSVTFPSGQIHSTTFSFCDCV